MNLNIKYFGLLAEVTDCSEEILTFSGTKVNELIHILFEKYPELKTKEFKIALNHQIVDSNSPISEGEIALLPPFSGG